MTDNKQHDTRTIRRPYCVTEIRMVIRPCRVRLFQERYHDHRRRQNGAGTGSGSRCYTKTGNLTNHKEADFTLCRYTAPAIPWYNKATE